MQHKTIFGIAIFIAFHNSCKADDAPAATPISKYLIRSLKHPDPKSSIRTIEFTPDGKLFAAGYPSGIVQLFDVKSGKELKVIETGKGYRGTADYAFPTPDFRTVYVTQEKRIPVGEGRPNPIQIGEVEIWSLADEKKVDVIPTMNQQKGVLAGYLSPNGETLITVESSRDSDPNNQPVSTVQWDLKTKKSKWLTFGYAMAAFSPNGKAIALAVFGKDKTKGRFDWIELSSGKVLWTMESESTIRGFSWPQISNDGTKLAVLDSEGRIDRPTQLKVIDVATGKKMNAIDSSKGTTFMAPHFSPDGTMLAINSYNGEFILWDYVKNVRLVEKQFLKQSLGHHAIFSPNGKRVAICVNKSDISENDNPFPQPTIHIYNVLKPTEVESLVAPPGYLGPLVWSSNGKMLAFGSAGAVHLFDVSR
jgi:WD40 repeat protein